jgi:hypothetical protein
MTEDDFAQLAGYVRQLADAMLVQARKIVELQERVQQLEAERITNAYGKNYEHD